MLQGFDIVRVVTFNSLYKHDATDFFVKKFILFKKKVTFLRPGHDLKANIESIYHDLVILAKRMSCF